MTEQHNDQHAHNHSHDHMPEGEESAPPGVEVMAGVRWTIIGLTAALAIWSVGHYFHWFDHKARSGSGGSAEVSESAADQYQCPMHPAVIMDHPGECPICGMTLVKIEKKPGGIEKAADTLTHGQDPAKAVPGLVPVTLTPERIQLAGVKTIQAAKGKMEPELRTIGTVSAREQGFAKVQPRFSGWIEELFVAQTGETVKKGQALVGIYSPELFTSQQEYLNARKWLKEPGSTSSGMADDAKKRLQLLGISDSDIAEIDRTGKAVRAFKLRAPVSGTVTRKDAVLGSYVQPGTELFEIADLTKVWVLADLYESQVARVKIGQKSSFEQSSRPGRLYSGKVDFIYPGVDNTTRTQKVRLEVMNNDGTLTPGSYGTVTLTIGAMDAVLVPSDALVDTGENQYVFIAMEGGRFEPRRVKAGSRSGDQVAILEGLEAGEEVVTTANFLIDSESRLRAAIEGLSNKPSAKALK